MADMIEKVAMALTPVLWGTREDEFGRDLPPQQFDNLTEDWQRAVCRYARAAIEAMRELPSELLALTSHDPGFDESWYSQWQDVIDAALEEGQNE